MHPFPTGDSQGKLPCLSWLDMMEIGDGAGPFDVELMVKSEKYSGCNAEVCCNYRSKPL